MNSNEDFKFTTLSSINVSAANSIFNNKAKPMKSLKGELKCGLNTFNCENVKKESILYTTIDSKYQRTTIKKKPTKKLPFKRKVSIRDKVKEEFNQFDKFDKLEENFENLRGKEKERRKSLMENNEPKEEEIKKEDIKKEEKKEEIKEEEILKIKYNRGLKPFSSTTKEPYVYSNKFFHPYSFFMGQKGFGFKSKGTELECPAPILLSNEEWEIEPPYHRKDILKYCEINRTLGLKGTNKEVAKKLSGMVFDLLAQIIKVPFGHKISLNVKMFEPRSIISRIPEYWSHYSRYVHPSADSSMTPLERMKNISVFTLSGLMLSNQQLKPFNPIIGETYQAEIQNDLKTKVYAEQISTSPYVTRFYVADKLSTLSCYFDLSPNTELIANRITVLFKGYIDLNFPGINEHITYSMPNPRIMNAKDETNRGCFFIGGMVLVDVKNGLKTVIKLGHNPKNLFQVDGVIMEWKFPQGYKFDYDTENNFCVDFKMDKKNLSKYKVLSVISGEWIDKVMVDNKVYWDSEIHEPTWIKPSRNFLPSDGRFREDLIWLFRSFYNARNEKERQLYMDYAQSWKVNMEKLNRTERGIKQKTRQNIIKREE
ncbi:MAG: oxysterol-binding protein, partial [archaeon]|nr:oxysterol-binding protein [archaeon]